MNKQAFLLNLMLFLPLASALAIATAGIAGKAQLSRALALGSSFLTMAVSLRFVPDMAADPGAYTAWSQAEWIPDWGISFTLGLDGLSGSLVLLTNFLVIISVLASWTAIERRRGEFYAFVMLLQTGILGTFLAQDLFLFYIFWELMLIPLYFLIGIFGSADRIRATMKFFLYTMAGSVLMLVGIIALHHEAKEILLGPTFSISELASVSQRIPMSVQAPIFLSFLLAFAIKAPLFPFHTWLPDAHTEAPTAGSILLAGVLLKTGVYGMMRIAIPLFPGPAHDYAPIVMGLSVVAIVWGALAAFAQEDMKRLVAYSSVSHMGFIVLGIFTFNVQAETGAAMQMLNHGISTGALFFCVGALYERRHTRLLGEFGGLAHNMRVYTILTVIVVLSSAGLPGLNGFVGEFLVLIGTFQEHPIMAAVASLGVILAAVYLLRMVQATFYGPLTNEKNKGLPDLNLREFAALMALILAAFWMGLFPRPWLRLVEPAAARLCAPAAAKGAPAAPKTATAQAPETEASL